MVSLFTKGKVDTEKLIFVSRNYVILYVWRDPCVNTLSVLQIKEIIEINKMSLRWQWYSNKHYNNIFEINDY